ncbi:MAG TPA: C2 family cysteine protease [Tepidisphaeraceae bacterium]|jgi:hypothetical protein|nr:C2 family cysteine protease [Tepidisphaeraceae bacterium]
MRCNRNTTKKLVAASSFELQNLESRTMMTAVGLGVKFAGGLLTVTGTTSADHINISHVGNSWTIANGTAWTVTKTLKVTKLSVNGGNGDDSITIDSSVTCPATLLGGAGNDTIVSNDTNSTSMNGGAGNDSLTSGANADTLNGDIGDDTLVGGAGADLLIGGAGNDSLSGNDGNDVIQGGLGNNTLSGGAGTDILNFTDHTAKQGVTIDLTVGTATMTGESDTIASDFEKLCAGQGNDSINGSAGDDYINGEAGNDTINGLGGNDQIWDGAGNDVVNGGDGNDSLYSNAGNDNLNGNDGDDTLIAIGGGTADSVTGGNGNDTFWVDSNVTEKVLDADSTEITEGAVHQVASFAKGVTKELTAPKIADPTIGKTFKYHNFSDHPIFEDNGPSINDIAQGQTGDCYFLATLASIAKIDPMRIQQSIVNLGDGTYAVRFFKNNVASYVRVDADLATYSWSATTLAYDNFGQGGAMWAPLIEKAFTYFRTTKCTYDAIASGMMSEVYSDFGASASSIAPNSAANAAAYVLDIKNLLDAGKSVTAACYTTGGANMITSHAYTVDHVVDNGDGTYSVVVRNPWGVDGNTSTDGTNDGYVTLTAAQAYVALGYVQSANV